MLFSGRTAPVSPGTSSSWTAREQSFKPSVLSMRLRGRASDECAGTRDFLVGVLSRVEFRKLALVIQFVSTHRGAPAETMLWSSQASLIPETCRDSGRSLTRASLQIGTHRSVR
jgi:hypothetical protein